MPGVAEANLMTGFACNDRPWVGMTALITSSDGVATAGAHAATLARYGRPEIFNPDQGSEFTGAAFTDALSRLECASRWTDADAG